jgi:hypothetical protein
MHEDTEIIMADCDMSDDDLDGDEIFVMIDDDQDI